MELPIYELKIVEDLQDDAEVSFVALVDKPAIMKDFHVFGESFIEPSKGEDKEPFLQRCIKYVIDEGKESEQAVAICNSLWEQHFAEDSYTDYPKQAIENAKIALRWAEENGWGECGTPVGKARANQLAKGEPISKDTISRMASFERHRQNSQKELGDGCGRLMWLAWGGDAGVEWASRKLEQLNKFAEVTCPIATQDIATNLKNRQTAINVAHYGPLNPNLPNEEYWIAKGKQFNTTPDNAKQSICGNCSFFNVSQMIKDCIATGIGNELDPYNVINAGDLGYCEAFDFKCASQRTCDAWVVGGPVKMAQIGPKGGIKESDKAPKSDTPNKNPKGEGSAKGDASGKKGAEVTKEQEQTLQKKVDDFNEKESNTKNGRATLGALKSVFQRGLGAYNTSHSPLVKSAEQWAFARVNAFLYLLKNGRPENPKYNTDYDLLPKDHPKNEKFAGEKISYDYDDTLSTERGKQMATNDIKNGATVYIISARQDKEGMLTTAKDLGIPESRVYATGSNKAKVEKVIALGITKHHDNNADVIKELGSIGAKFIMMQGFAIQNEEQHIISGPLMLADTPIYRSNSKFGEHYVTFSPETIKDIAIKFSKKGYQKNVNLMHDANMQVDGLVMFESFIVDKARGILPMAGYEDAKDGSWFGSFYVENEQVWNLIKEGKVKGFSVEGYFDYAAPNKEESYAEKKLRELSELLKVPF